MEQPVAKRPKLSGLTPYSPSPWLSGGTRELASGERGRVRSQGPHAGFATSLLSWGVFYSALWLLRINPLPSVPLCLCCLLPREARGVVVGGQGPHGHLRPRGSNLLRVRDAERGEGPSRRRRARGRGPGSRRGTGAGASRGACSAGAGATDASERGSERTAAADRLRRQGPEDGGRPREDAWRAGAGCPRDAAALGQLLGRAQRCPAAVQGDVDLPGRKCGAGVGAASFPRRRGPGLHPGLGQNRLPRSPPAALPAPGSRADGAASPAPRDSGGSPAFRSQGGQPLSG